MQKRILKAALAAAFLAAASAHAEVVVVAAKGAGAVTIEAACAAFLGKAGSLVPVNMAEGNAARDEFHKKYCDKDPQQVKAVWAKLLFTGKAGAKPKEVGSADEMKKAVAGDTNAVGYLDKAAVDASLKIISN